MNGGTKKHNKLSHSDAQKIDKDTNVKKREDPASHNWSGSSSLMSTTNNGFLQLNSISMGNEKRCFDTIAHCDSGTTVSSVDQNFVDLLRLKGKESVVSDVGIHGSSDLKTQIVVAGVSLNEAETTGGNVTLCKHPNLNFDEKENDFRKLN